MLTDWPINRADFGNFFNNWHRVVIVLKIRPIYRQVHLRAAKRCCGMPYWRIWQRETEQLTLCSSALFTHIFMLTMTRENIPFRKCNDSFYPSRIDTDCAYHIHKCNI